MLETCVLTHIRAFYHFKMLLLAEVIGRGTLWRALRHYPFKSYKHTSAADWILQCCWHNTRHTYRCLKMEVSSVFFAIFEPKSVREWCLVGEAWRRHLGTTRDTALLPAGSRHVLNRWVLLCLHRALPCLYEQGDKLPRPGGRCTLYIHIIV